MSHNRFTKAFLAELERRHARADREFVFHPSVDSTSTDMKRRLAAGAKPGTVVAAEMQTAGRGRRGNRWHSPREGNLYLSLAVAVPEPVQAVLPLLPLAAGVAIWDVINGLGATQPKLKWPNDLLLSDRKLAGILCESTDMSKRPVLSVVGLGLNIGSAAFPGELQAIATSLAEQVAGPVDPPILAAAWVAGLEDWTKRLGLGNRDAVIAAWRERAERFGRRVRVGDTEGNTVDLAQDGRLILRKDDGELVTISGGVVESMEV